MACCTEKSHSTELGHRKRLFFLCLLLELEMHGRVRLSAIIVGATIKWQVVRILQKRTSRYWDLTRKNGFSQPYTFCINDDDSFAFAPYRVRLSKKQSSIFQLDVVVWSENCDGQANAMI